MDSEASPSAWAAAGTRRPGVAADDVDDWDGEGRHEGVDGDRDGDECGGDRSDQLGET